MGDRMMPVPFRQLLERMMRELSETDTIFGIHIDQFYSRKRQDVVKVFGYECLLPVGPAAGPHTQLTQNIIASYLTGGRFFELKTVQVLDELEIEKPCIDARDEGYNVEWSTEFTLPQAYDEYLKAWILVHVLETLMPTGPLDAPDYRFMFNMSVGYDLAGIRTEKMQRYIDSMVDASAHPLFVRYLDELREFASDPDFFAETPFLDRSSDLFQLAGKISPSISPTVTLSTMHGCPPDEIEAICTYMLQQKKLHTFVKLNPTLLGYDAVRELLDRQGYGYVTLGRSSFDHDLQYPDAIAMLRRLSGIAAAEQLGFGVKLTNTLGTVNDQGQLPGGEMYLSGRALFPVSIRLAARLSREFEGRLPISYSGGADAGNIGRIFAAGIRPITIATDLLKPGGYGRFGTYASQLEEMEAWDLKSVDVEELEALADSAAEDPVYHKDQRGFESVHVPGALPLFDCYIAPCVQACPIHQDVPEYVHLVGKGLYAEALELIYEKNPLPNITGHICDHQCMYNCTRRDYEGWVDIRKLKRIAADHGSEVYRKEFWTSPETAAVKAAVIGAGPAGLSAAFFLARSGFVVTVLERETSAGGVVQHVIPDYRLPAEAIRADIDFVAAQGVSFQYGVTKEQTRIDTLKAAGYSYIVYGIGAEKDNPMPLEGSTGRVVPALEFLGRYARERECLELGRHVVVVGGGNTAMDGARSAMTLPGVESVKVLYRRTRHEMPADLEEYANAAAEGAEFLFLTLPERLEADGTLLCRRMELGEPDVSGRRRPVPTEETFTLQADTLITAIGEHVDGSYLAYAGILCGDKGWAEVDPETLETAVDRVYLIGDAQTGPSTIVRCIAGARKAAEAILDRELGQDEPEELHLPDDDVCNEDESADEFDDLDPEDLREAEDSFFAEIRSKKMVRREPGSRCLPSSGGAWTDAEYAAYEASRCIECSYICNKCVEVCPNRANAAVDVRDSGIFEHPFQIVHIDAFCNECGNCAIFCPWEGKPYTDKFTLFQTKADMDSSSSPGMCLEGDTIHVRDQHVCESLQREGQSDISGSARLDPDVLELVRAIAAGHSHLLG